MSSILQNRGYGIRQDVKTMKKEIGAGVLVRDKQYRALAHTHSLCLQRTEHQARQRKFRRTGTIYCC